MFIVYSLDHCYFLLPPANEVWGKVIFSVACVKKSVHGGHLPQCMLGYHPPNQAGTPPGFPLRLENLEKWEGIFQFREKSGNFEQTGKVREIHTKYWKTQEIWDKYYLIFLVIFKWTLYYLLKWIKFSVKKNKTLKKILEIWKKILEKSGKSQGILSVRKSGNPDPPGPGRYPPDQARTPPDQAGTPPSRACWEIRSTSYWKAILFDLFRFHSSFHIVWIDPKDSFTLGESEKTLIDKTTDIKGIFAFTSAFGRCERSFTTSSVTSSNFSPVRLTSVLKKFGYNEYCEKQAHF